MSVGSLKVEGIALWILAILSLSAISYNAIYQAYNLSPPFIMAVYHPISYAGVLSPPLMLITDRMRCWMRIHPT